VQESKKISNFFHEVQAERLPSRRARGWNQWFPKASPLESSDSGGL